MRGRGIGRKETEEGRGRKRERKNRYIFDKQDNDRQDDGRQDQVRQDESRNGRTKETHLKIYAIEFDVAAAWRSLIISSSSAASAVELSEAASAASRRNFTAFAVPLSSVLVPLSNPLAVPFTPKVPLNPEPAVPFIGTPAPNVPVPPGCPARNTLFAGSTSANITEDIPVTRNCGTTMNMLCMPCVSGS